MSGITRFLENKVCVQDALYWGAPVSDGYGFVYSQPKLIKCRWEDSTETITNNQGVLVVCRASVMVIEDLEAGGVLYLGNFSGITNEHRTDPLTLDGAFTIKRVDKIPLFGSTDEFVRKVWL